ncbi:putative l-asparaginase I [Schistosoma mansoni]|uniref:putative l-asparaginase I n=1 Tax=Schistosoma mansoni TaxID=6183 RepID=UPI0001A63F53|nr:putative l-asparaginase I [Schistosoma mansoni]|eukprot:XP_018652037.1 putative l-asparaginase I [Schistosoma mansoni]
MHSKNARLYASKVIFGSNNKIKRDENQRSLFSSSRKIVSVVIITHCVRYLIDPVSRRWASFVGSPMIDQSLVDLALKIPKCLSVSRVLVLYTGGTIGMKCVNGSYCSVENFFLPTLNKMPTFCDSDLTESDHIQTYALPIDKTGHRILYTVVEYWPLLDSSDLSMNEWKRIAQDIYAFYNEFDGFVVLHGTDTLAYTASALSFMLENLGRPVVLTGAQLPVFEFRSDGWNNFLGALMIAGGKYAICEVTVLFHAKLFRGSRVVKCSSNNFDAFESPNYPAIAELGTEITINYDLIFRTPGLPKPFCIHTNLCQDVAILNIFPLISKEHIISMLAPPIKGVVLRTYGAGNIPSSRQDLLDALKEASDRGILMVNVTQCWRGGVKAVYSTGLVLNEYGVTPGYDMTTEAALTKLAYILSKTENKDYSSKRAMLLKSLRGEVTVEGEDSRAANLSLYNTNCLNQDRNLMIYFAKLFSTTSLDDSEGCTPLHKSAFYGHISATKYLLECGVSVHIADKNGYTPLLCALNSLILSSELVQLLLDVGAVLNSESQLVTKLVHQAVSDGDIQRLRLYQLCGYSFYNMDEEGRSALHVAVTHRQLDSIKFLISPIYNEENSHNKERSNVETTELEYGAGVDPKCQTIWGTSALDEAKLRNFNDIVQLLEKYQ